MNGQGTLSPEVIRAAEIIKNGGLVAFPTETFYGLAADPFNPEALKRLFKLKGRSSKKPVLVLIDKPERLPHLVRDIPQLYKPLMEKLWPGPLTLIFDGVDGLPSLLTDKKGTVGIRWSSEQLACQLAEAAGGIITGTSANPSGQPAAVTAEQVNNIFPDDLDYILEGGQTPGGSGSTIVTIREGLLHQLRKGALPFASIVRDST